MSESSPGEPPSRWTVLNDYSKTIITISGALLAFISTFSDKLGLASGGILLRIIISFSIICLMITIGTALAIPAFLDRYLRISADGNPAEESGSATPEDWNIIRPRSRMVSKILANCSFTAFVLASISLGSFAIVRTYSTTAKGPAAAINESCEVLSSFSGIPEAQWQAESLLFDSRVDKYTGIFIERKTGFKFEVIMPKEGIPSSIKRVP